MGSAASKFAANPDTKFDKAAVEAAIGSELYNSHAEKFFKEHADEDGTATGKKIHEFAHANGLVKESEGGAAKVEDAGAKEPATADEPSTEDSADATTAPVYDKALTVEIKYFNDVFAKMPSMAGKTVAITGCTSGTGFCLAEAVAKKGAGVVLLNRPSERAQNALAKIKAVATDPNVVTHVDCDLQKFESVRAAGAKLLELGVPIDVLVNNAGIMASGDIATVDGYDVQMQTNHLSHFLLTSLVWPALQKAASVNGQARVVQHSSGARKMVPKLLSEYLGKNGGNLGGDEPGGNFTGARWVRYAQTKLANLGFSLALADKIAAAGPDSASANILSLSAHPGLSATQLQVRNASEDPSMNATYENLMKRAQAVEDGTCGILRAACDTAKDIVAGTMIGPEAMTGPAIVLPAADEQARVSPEDREMLWQASIEATGADPEFVTKSM